MKKAFIGFNLYKDISSTTDYDTIPKDTRASIKTYGNIAIVKIKIAPLIFKISSFMDVSFKICDNSPRNSKNPT